MDRYPTRYMDSRGSETTAIDNDGETLRINIRGLEFTGNDFDSLSPPPDVPPGQLAQFALNQGDLCSCRLECQIGIPIEDHGLQKEGILSVELVLGEPSPNGGIDREDLHLTLRFDRGRFASPGESGFFEVEMLAIQAQLPEGTFMRACINCMFSDYSPYGNGLFGGMMCFRNLKEEYVKARGKAGIFAIHDRYERMVQETYLCPEFERRMPGIGYRG